MAGTAHRRVRNSSPADGSAGLLIQGLINQKAKLPGDLGTECSRQSQTLVLLQGRGWHLGTGVPCAINPPFINPLKVRAAPQTPKVPQLHSPLTWGGMDSAPFIISR